ncbi:ABC transporter permease [Pseudonocardia nigra]|uniref:ABC transporter permease n=1 Tax=Pseudonocardia nigra TaxID=1921578 RepID=UPI001C604EF9|nr:ABC transporter permease [Pseudonocardia nigra]
MRRAAPIAVGACVVALALLVGALLPFDAVATDLSDRFAGPSLAHPLGTDHLGRDALARLAAGARLSVGFTLLAVAISAVAGTALGLLAGYRGGWPAQVLQRIVDVLIAVPSIVIGLVLAAVLRPGVTTLLLAVLVTGWTPFARLAAGLAVREAGAEYVTGAVALGAGDARILARHILPNAVRPLTAHACLRFANTLLAVAGLSFLGLGPQPPTPEWGAMLNEARPYLFLRPGLVLVPAVAIVGVALLVTLLGRALDRRWN